MTAYDTYNICSKCSNPLICDMGMHFCSACGLSAGRLCDTSLTAFSQSHAVLKSSYSRKNRFQKKLIASLRCLVNYTLDEDMLQYLRRDNIQSPTALLKSMSKYPVKSGSRRPYLYVTFYWRALGFDVPQITERDLFCLQEDFDKIYFAWERQQFKKPMFPYAFLLRQIVLHGDKRYTEAMHMLCEFVRKLRCPQRKKRYSELFNKCINFVYNDI